MRIHVVSSGETPWTIARKYNIDVNRLREANGLDALPSLVVGQALIIPGVESLVTVRPGESLSSIASRFGVSAESIQQRNNLTNTALRPGQRILIPEKPKRYGVIESNGFIQPSNPEKETRIINESAPFLTYLTPFSYQVNADGSLVPLDDQNIISTGRRFRAAPMLSVSNISSSGGFDTPLINALMQNQQTQTALINNILATIRNKGFYGVIIDFERISPTNREAYNNFLRKVVAALHPNYTVATALAPKTYDVTAGAWHGAHDYRAHGEIVDFVVIMTYEWGWSGGPPLAVAPLNEVKKVINYAVSVIPPKKIMMGMALYGYDWTLPYVPRGEYAEAIGHLEAISRAAQYGAAIQYDRKSASPFYNYYDRGRNQHVVWFEDARSLMEKYKLVNEYGLRGVSYWSLAQPSPQTFYLLDSMFTITKVIPG